MTYHDIDIPLPAFIAIDWIGMTLALIPIILRFLLRRRQSQPPPFTRNLSDALVLLSWLSGVVLISINTWKNSLRQRYIHYPHSQLYYSVPRPLSAHLLYVSWISLFFIYISLWAAKFALLAFYASLLRLQGRWARAMLALATVFTAATFTLHIALLTRWCTPTSSNWNVDGHLCSAVHDIRSVTISTAANVATDLVILCLPLFALASLRRGALGLPPEHSASASSSSSSEAAVVPEKAAAAAAASPSLRMAGGRLGKAELSGLAFVLCMAALSITAALARFVTLQLVQSVPKANITHTIDVWALVEIVASLLAVCLPSCRAFVRREREARGSQRGSSREMMVVVVERGVGVRESGEEVELDLSILEEGVAEDGERVKARRHDSGCSGVDGGTPAAVAVVGTAHASSERLL